MISLNEESEASVKKLIERFDAIEPSIGWWHYIKGLWLVVDPTGKLTASQLRSEACTTFPDAHVMVMEIPTGGDWSGFGPEKMKQWLVDQWDKPQQ